MNKKIWCTDKPIGLGISFFSSYANLYKHMDKFIRCPKCNKRLQPRLETCQDTGTEYVKINGKLTKAVSFCFHLYIPAHKGK
jgi:hypothetical protein